MKLKNPVTVKPTESAAESSSGSPQTIKCELPKTVPEVSSCGTELAATVGGPAAPSQAETSERIENDAEGPVNDDRPAVDDAQDSQDIILRSIQEGLGRRSDSARSKVKAKGVGLSLLGGYADSDESD